MNEQLETWNLGPHLVVIMSSGTRINRKSPNEGVGHELVIFPRWGIDEDIHKPIPYPLARFSFSFTTSREMKVHETGIILSNLKKRRKKKPFSYSYV